jgi:hypothetical protein
VSQALEPGCQNLSSFPFLLSSSQAANAARLKLEDPRNWCDKRGRTPYAIAHIKGFSELARALEPGSLIEPM